ncbi:TPR-like protein [Wallemia mellicola]|uniref:TPR-like protein n=2 Tax=Wallemia mellicola TaxID=1708541 RepID=A0A4T0TT74_9BASI|nr:TPR-like protein [Wallemia mellicola CBS 633.66]TIB74418.1 hypothetical protein E3Q24_00528 [Wallemia mellicola]EIM21594.1 TPR-like protein [Wallemia mellicola CBS 633.66]TIB78949.1 hypothetical protein E3Q23_00530 [Wallemia mellicola]TIB81746.1 TPR-like protein [Wallemia mellicola]TIB90047.1 TPR-like protein [Wallemia mellicola]|eukprot:XP_006958291.1 TPR-like protein [Wallemia mellicola CBS 633.66]
MNTPVKSNKPTNQFLNSPTVKKLFNSPNCSILSASPQINNKYFDLDLDNDDLDILETNNDETSLIDKLRLWRHDAMMQHLYTTAQFWADKCLHLTKDPNDAFWLAQIYFYQHSYLRALNLLTKPFIIDDDTPVRLYQISVFCRYLTAQCQVKLDKWNEALELLGDQNPFKNHQQHGTNVKSSDGGIKIESSLCHLRGLIHLQLNSTERAKQSFIEALSLDVKNYDSFVKLVGGAMLTDDEEWHFVQRLQYKEQIEHNSDFIKLIYTTQLKKTSHSAEIQNARNELSTDSYGFKQNADILQSQADSLYAQFKFQDCYNLTSNILKHHPSHPSTLPLQIACMQHLPSLRPSLFLLSHELVETDPDSAISWYAVGVYYYLGEKYVDARRYFSKSSLMDPRFEAAWIGFAHAFAMEGEHDQAITAYSTCSRLFPGTHLPLLYIGMQHIQLANNNLASNFLQGSLSICDQDPLIWHESAVVAYYNQEYEKSIVLFNKTLTLIGDNTDKSWYSTHLGLGQAYRKTRQYNNSKDQLLKALDLNPNCVVALSTLGIIHNYLDEIEESIEIYHKSLSIQPGDAMTTELLKLAVNSNLNITSANNFKRLPSAFTKPTNNIEYLDKSQQHTISMVDDSSIIDNTNSNIDITANETIEQDEESMLIE